MSERQTRQQQAQERMSEQGVIYLIHFDTPLAHARHYLGWSSDIDTRLACHRAGGGARLMAAVKRADITWQVAGAWRGDRNLERRLKSHSSTRLCPFCTAKPRPVRRSPRGPRAEVFRPHNIRGRFESIATEGVTPMVRACILCSDQVAPYSIGMCSRNVVADMMKQAAQQFFGAMGGDEVRVR